MTSCSIRPSGATFVSTLDVVYWVREREREGWEESKGHRIGEMLLRQLATIPEISVIHCETLDLVLTL